MNMVRLRGSAFNLSCPFQFYHSKWILEFIKFYSISQEFKVSFAVE